MAKVIRFNDYLNKYSKKFLDEEKTYQALTDVYKNNTVIDKVVHKNGIYFIVK